MYSLKELYDYFINSGNYKNQHFLTDTKPYAPWWGGVYYPNYSQYDRTFVRLYSSFTYYGDDDSDIKTVLDNLREDFNTWLSMNSERYRQLYRVLSVPDAQNELFENVNGTTTTTTTYGKTSTHNIGEKTDVHITDNDSYTDTTENTTSASTDENIHKVSAFDSDDFSNDSSDTLNNGARTQTVHNDVDARKETLNSKLGAQTNTDADTGSDTVTETRHGNIGVTTVSQMLEQHVNFWDSMEYMTKIFADFAKNFLVVG